MRTWEDEKSEVYLLLVLVRHDQNNYFFGRTKLEKYGSSIMLVVTSSEVLHLNFK